MKFNWSEYFDLAQQLAGITAINSSEAATNSQLKISEAKLRSSVSRAYYAAFCTARNYLRDVLQDPRLLKTRTGDINEHQYVANEFIHNKAKNKKLIEIGRDLSRLREYRNKSDYNDTIYNLEKETRFSLQLAKNIISILAELTFILRTLKP